MKMNLPNRLTVIRLCLVPIIIVFGILPSKIINPYLSNFICAALFIGTALTDMFDGKIARKRGLITDFGKFLDPVADKFMVIGALFVILYKQSYSPLRAYSPFRILIFFTIIIVVFRELAVTSMRLVVSTGQNIVVAANKLGKIKTVSQVVAISTVFLEPVVQYIFVMIFNHFASNPIRYAFGTINPLSYITVLFSVIMTLWSGINYIVSYWKYLDPKK